MAEQGKKKTEKKRRAGGFGVKRHRAKRGGPNTSSKRFRGQRVDMGSAHSFNQVLSDLQGNSRYSDVDVRITRAFPRGVISDASGRVFTLSS